MVLASSSIVFIHSIHDNVRQWISIRLQWGPRMLKEVGPTKSLPKGQLLRICCSCLATLGPNPSQENLQSRLMVLTQTLTKPERQVLNWLIIYVHIYIHMLLSVQVSWQSSLGIKSTALSQAFVTAGDFLGRWWGPAWIRGSSGGECKHHGADGRTCCWGR